MRILKAFFLAAGCAVLLGIAVAAQKGHKPEHKHRKPHPVMMKHARHRGARIKANSKRKRMPGRMKSGGISIDSAGAGAGKSKKDEFNPNKG